MEDEDDDDEDKVEADALEDEDEDDDNDDDCSPLLSLTSRSFPSTPLCASNADSPNENGGKTLEDGEEEDDDEEEEVDNDDDGKEDEDDECCKVFEIPVMATPPTTADDERVGVTGLPSVLDVTDDEVEDDDDDDDDPILAPIGGLDCERFIATATGDECIIGTGPLWGDGDGEEEDIRGDDNGPNVGEDWGEERPPNEDDDEEGAGWGCVSTS